MFAVGGALVLFVMLIMKIMSYFTLQTYVICGLILSYVSCLIMAVSTIGVSKFIIDKYELKIII